MTANANATIVKGMFITSNHPSAAHLVTCQIVNGGVKYGLVALTSVSSAGYVSGTNPQNLFSQALIPGLALDSDANPYLFLITGDTLQCTFATALTAAAWLDIIVIAADFS